MHEWQVEHPGIVRECPSNHGIIRHRVCGASWAYTQVTTVHTEYSDTQHVGQLDINVHTVYSDTRVCEGQGGHPGIVWECPSNYGSWDTQTHRSKYSPGVSE